MFRVLVLIASGLVVSGFAGCDADGDDTGATGPATSGADTETSTADTETSTAGPVDGDAFCAQFDTLDGCTQSSTADVSCGWKDIMTYDASCSELAGGGQCLWIPVDSTDPGCGGFPPTCPGDAFFREVDGGVEVSYECGGSLPAGFEPCPAMSGELYAMPECNCGCDASQGSSSTDDGGASSTGG